MTIDLTQRWQVIQGDCLALLRDLPDGCVDCIIADPPYFRVKDEAWDNQWKNEGAFLEWLETVLAECARALAPNGSVFVFTSPGMNTRVEVMMRRLFVVLNNIRWIKEAGWHKKAERGALRSWLSPWEGIVFAEQRAADCSAMKAAGYDEAARLLHQRVYAPIGAVVRTKRQSAGLQRWQVDTACSPSRKPTGLCYRWEEGACLPTLEQWVDLCRLVGDSRDYEDLRRDYEDLRRPFSVGDSDDAYDCWRFPTVPPRVGKHPCEKPGSMLRYMIESTTRPDALIVDPFVGSGATGAACADTGRRFIGFEIDPGYCDIARRRIADAVPMFTNA